MRPLFADCMEVYHAGRLLHSVLLEWSGKYWQRGKPLLYCLQLLSTGQLWW